MMHGQTQIKFISVCLHMTYLIIFFFTPLPLDRHR